MAGDDFRSRLDRIDRERRAHEERAEKAKREAVMVLNRMCSRMMALHQQSSELLTRQPPRVVVPPFAPHENALTERFTWVPSEGGSTSPPYIVAEDFDPISYNPFTDRWFCRELYRDDGITEEEVFERFAERMAKWVLDVFPVEEAKRVKDTNAQVARAAVIQNEKENTIIGCSAVTVCGIITIILFYNEHPFLAIALAATSLITFYNWTEIR